MGCTKRDIVCVCLSMCVPATTLSTKIDRCTTWKFRQQGIGDLSLRQDMSFLHGCGQQGSEIWLQEYDAVVPHFHYCNITVHVCQPHHPNECAVKSSLVILDTGVFLYHLQTSRSDGPMDMVFGIATLYHYTTSDAWSHKTFVFFGHSFWLCLQGQFTLVGRGCVILGGVIGVSFVIFTHFSQVQSIKVDNAITFQKEVRNNS